MPKSRKSINPFKIIIIFKTSVKILRKASLSRVKFTFKKKKTNIFLQFYCLLFQLAQSVSKF